MSNIERIKCLIIGSGPAGYTAGIYAARSNLSPVLYTGMELGGQLITTTTVDNFPGYPEGIDGQKLMENMRQHAERLNVDIRMGTVTSVDFNVRPFVINIDNKSTIEAETVIIATGATARYLGLESERKFRGMGVSACATCDGFFYKGKITAVVGGGDTACEEAIYLASISKKVYMIVRKDHLRACEILQATVRSTPNIEILFEHNTDQVLGDESGVTGMRLINAKGEKVDYDIDGFFLAIGHTPNTDPFKDFLELDENGYIITQPDSSRTNIPGVFAAGDVKDPTYRQAIIAAGSGCMAALDCEKYILITDTQEAGQ